MTRFLISRLGYLFLTIFLILAAVFALVRLTGDPITTSLGDRLADSELARRISEAGFDRPLWEQFLSYLDNLFRLDLGNSFISGQPVVPEMLSHAAASSELAVFSLLIAILIAVPLAVVAAKKPNGILDSVIRSGAVTIYALPVFLLALVLKLVFSSWLALLPPNGRIAIQYQVALQAKEGLTGFYLLDSLLLWDWGMFSSALSHLLLPAFAIGILIAATLLRVIRVNLVSALASEPIEFAKTLGLSKRRLFWPHASKLIAPQVLTSFGYSVASVIGGLVYAEVSFEWRGLGWLLTESVLDRDFQLVQAIVILLAVVIVITNTVVDLVIYFLDRRARLGQVMNLAKG